MTEAEEVESGVDTVERFRRPASWTAWILFGVSFVILLVLSGTPAWTPENRWVNLTGEVLRLSGFTAITLSFLPYVLRLFEQIASFWKR